ncbi:MAG: tRNA (guanosine(46)-N7)-methyltransferase TrmB [Kiritimatiellae bacterium]|nr:tRNA (guanosine(46)-N7)-methyltransferase TrmB [Kiritimatiellia bacterium]
MSDHDVFVRLTAETVLSPLNTSALFRGDARPLVVDLGCGKGRLLLAHARRHPDMWHLGVDRMLGRLRKVARGVQRLGLANVRLLRMDALYAACYLLPRRGVHEMFVAFPDPWPKLRHHRHRLFGPLFFDALAATLVPGGAVHVATDHMPYFEVIHRAVAADRRFEIAPVRLPTEEERTDFELGFLYERPIGRITFRLRPNAAARKEHEP